ncbi:MAG TPA: PIG-L family deacetylase [Patescibacteria group bacterium]|nr:PIG-L family deacetylase [Patescibacteria group bacterium]
MKRISLFTLLFLLKTSAIFAQYTPQPNSAEILQSLKKLNTVGSVLYVAAHPDDENTRLLAYLAKERNLRTGYLSITRGDGGQNLIGKEQGEMLGLIRTQELLAARRTDGAEQFFTRANDFGFSKNPEETFGFWNKDSILADVVWTIRRFKPDVIICRFPTTGEGGHGHHTASAILALEAFDAAADPTRFPQQLALTETWQAKRILWNTFNFGGNNTTSEDQLKIDIGVYNPLLGKYYGEIAAESRSMHKSQGFGSARTRGSSIEYFKFLKGEPVKTDIFEGINQTWKRIPGAEKIQTAINDAFKKYDAQSPEKIIPDLTTIFKNIQLLKETNPEIRYWKAQKIAETQNLLVSVAGLWLEVFAADYRGIAGKPIDITTQILKGNNVPVKVNSISYFNSNDTTTSLLLKNNELYSFKSSKKIPGGVDNSNPYWLNEKHDIGFYKVPSQDFIGKAENEAALKVRFNIELAGIPLQIIKPVVFKNVDPVKGEVYRPFEILPPATINFTEKSYIFTDSSFKKISFTIRANTDSVSGTVLGRIPKGWISAASGESRFNLLRKGDEVTLETLIAPEKNSSDGVFLGSILINGEEYFQGIQRVDYDHIPAQFVLRDAEAKLVNISLKKAGTNIGYIPGAGDDVPAALQQIGYTVTMLNDELLSKGNLAQYDAIVTGVRAYNTNDRLQAHYNLLMDYVRGGGNLIVQYNTNNRIGPIVAKISPYPLTITRDRVTDENAEIRFLKPDHTVLNFPNKITQDDFKAWIQERGIYFAGEISPDYERIFSINDPNEKPNEGSLIIAKYGKGNFVYTGLAFFRELPAGVPGAYRLFVNLLSLPKN